MDSVFPTTDIAIPALRGFICQAATALAHGSTLASAVRAALAAHPSAEPAFDFSLDDSQLDRDFALSGALSFPNETLPGALTFEHARTRAALSLSLDPMLARDASAFVHALGSGKLSAQQIRAELDQPLDALFDALLEHAIAVEAPPPPSLRLSSAEQPGVTRLQHAGLLYRGHRAGVLIDPHLHSALEPDQLDHNVLRCQLDGLVDAIAISHSHSDHYHLPTLMSFPRDIPIIVPQVPRATMLCPDYAATLRALGFTRVTPLAWYDPPVVIGDLELHALPFYGEQPLLSGALRHPDLRNYGNTYLVRHSTYSSWLLVDSGNDSQGRMTAVAEHVRARFGPIDWLISNLREFAITHPLYITGGHYWLALAPDDLRRFASLYNDVITLGAHGVAELCAITRARSVLPYAHWWSEPGTIPNSEEPSLLIRLHDALSQLNASTQVTAWNIGDSASAAAGGRTRIAALG